MQAENKLSTLIMHMLLDGAGLTLLALGVAKLQVNVEFLPESLRFPHESWVFLLAGISLFLPTLVLIYKFSTRSQSEQV